MSVKETRSQSGWEMSAFTDAQVVEPATVLSAAKGKPIGARKVRFSRSTAAQDTPVYRRTDLGVGQKIDGPLIVEERETTTVIRPLWKVEVAADGSLIAQRKLG